MVDIIGGGRMADMVALGWILFGVMGISLIWWIVAQIRGEGGEENVGYTPPGSRIMEAPPIYRGSDTTVTMTGGIAPPPPPTTGSNIVEQNKGRLVPRSCPNCGAPVRGFECEYCGTVFERDGGSEAWEEDPVALEALLWQQTEDFLCDAMAGYQINWDEVRKDDL